MFLENVQVWYKTACIWPHLTTETFFTHYRLVCTFWHCTCRWQLKKLNGLFQLSHPLRSCLHMDTFRHQWSFYVRALRHKLKKKRPIKILWCAPIGASLWINFRHKSSVRSVWRSPTKFVCLLAEMRQLMLSKVSLDETTIAQSDPPNQNSPLWLPQSLGWSTFLTRKVRLRFVQVVSGKVSRLFTVFSGKVYRVFRHHASKKKWS